MFTEIGLDVLEERAQRLLDRARHLVTEDSFIDDDRRTTWMHRLRRVRFHFSSYTNSAGGAWNDGRVELSHQFFRIPDNFENEFEDTVLHEFAHVMVGARHGHDSEWKLACEVVGCSGRVRHSMSEHHPPPKRDKIARMKQMLEEE